MFAAPADGETVTVPQGTPLRNAPRNVLLAYQDPDGVVWLNSFDGNANEFHTTLFNGKNGISLELRCHRNLKTFGSAR